MFCCWRIAPKLLRCPLCYFTCCVAPTVPAEVIMHWYLILKSIYSSHHIPSRVFKTQHNNGANWHTLTHNFVLNYVYVLYVKITEYFFCLVVGWILYVWQVISIVFWMRFKCWKCTSTFNKWADVKCHYIIWWERINYIYVQESLCCSEYLSCRLGPVIKDHQSKANISICASSCVFHILWLNWTYQILQQIFSPMLKNKGLEKIN